MTGALRECRPNPHRVWKFERVDGSHVYATGEEVTLTDAGYHVRGEWMGWGPYQTWEDLSIFAKRTGE